MKNRVQSRPFALPFTLLLLLLLAALPAAAESPAPLRISPFDGGAEVELDRPATRPAPAGAIGAPEMRTGGVTLLGRAPEGVTLLVESIGVTGDLPTATDNDFTRIDEAIQAVALLGDGTIVRLVGTFDWSEPNAYASWEAVGYTIVPPPGVADVTIRASALGDAMVAGPGEIADPSVWWEGFLGPWAGSYRGWTIENLIVRGFDIAIFCGYTVSTAGEFDDLTIRNNRFEMLNDLPGNSAAALGEPSQNIALHLSFGKNQTIEGNEFVIPGDTAGDDSDPVNVQLAASVALQSHNSGGVYFDGLRIVDNLVRVTGAQAAIPERVFGLWENGGAHTSNIEVSGNVFRNEHPANDPALNYQRGLRVTSHSSATTTVLYANNRVEGAAVGIGWLDYSTPVSPRATVYPVIVEGNTLLGNQIGIWVFTDNLGTVTIPRMSKAIVRYNRMAGNATGLRNHDAEVMAENNWFGCEDGPAAAACDPALYTGTAGFFDVDPWLTLGIELGAPSVEVGSSVPATATVTGNSAGVDLGAIPFPVADMAFTGVKGTMPTPVATADGTAVSSFTGTAVGVGTATAQLDNGTATASLLVTQGGTVVVQAFSVTGGTPTAMDNDYTRIDEVVQLVADGSVVELVGDFDWTEPNAYASWEAADYAINAPGGFADVTIRAAAPGGAVIEGPGEIADTTIYYEGFIALWAGSYRGWTIENLVVKGFDWPIYCYAFATSDFDDLSIRNNRLELHADVAGSAPPAPPAGEPYQNLGIHMSAGMNQTVEGNEFVLAGDGVSDTVAGLKATSVVLQSSSHGGTRYDGLRIVDNLIRVTGAQSADPEWIYGIWENGHAHASDIEISGNTFLNEDPANDPLLNKQRAFRVTSHSSASTTVSYANNRVEGANIGIHWLGDNYTINPPAAVLPVLLTGNTLLGNGTAVWVHTDGTTELNSKATLAYNRIFGNGVGVQSDTALVSAENNWWGCSAGPAGAGCDTAMVTGGGVLDADPWLTLGIALGAPSVEVGAAIPATATVTGNSAGAALGAIPFPVTDIGFAGVRGTMVSPVATADGTAVSSFTGTAVGIGSATAALDNATATAELLVTQGGTVVVEAFSVTGGTPSLAENDYTRINDVVQLVSDSSTVELVGSFDWTEPFAALSWERGSDGVAGTGDDYAVAAPGNFQNVTIRAAAPGGAVIQGPGDLPGANLEGFLGMWDGSYVNWTVENLDIRGFDLGIGMFFSTGAQFDGVTIRNNRIELPADLNATVAPDDVNQNIAIHLARGVDQTIESNEIVLAGTGVSNAAVSKAASVALQSNTHGGSSYDGLQIVDNLIRVTGAQSADPEWIYGIWENGHAHASDIEISGNTFLNEDPANDPLLNKQRAFRVTSHSSATTTVSYESNRVEGANIGIHWMGDGYAMNPPSTVLPVLVTGNTLLGNGTGVWVHTDGTTELNSKATLAFNRIFGNGVGVQSDTALVMAENNWWGCNAGPGDALCDSAVITGGGVLDADPWLTLGIALGTTSLEVGAITPATATVTGNSAGAMLGPIAFPATGIGFVGVNGTMPTPVVTADGTAVSSFTGTVAGLGSATAQLDNATVTASLLVTQGGTVPVQAFSVTGGTPTATENDYTRINDVVQLVSDGSIVELVGNFDWTEPFAAASWEAGSDGIPGTGDDYACTAPGGFDDVTIRAAALGGAVIQGPGDLPAVNLETFLGMWDGSYQGWTVENLDIRGFDVTLYAYFTASSDFNGLTVQGNRIEIPTDLNATVAPDDVNQNMGLHLSSGQNQTIEGNEFVLAGTGVSDTAGTKRAASVVLQSSTHGGSAYDGLRIVDNLIRVTGAQSADPELIYGIWENGHAHASDIEISGNTFLNEDPANDPLLNKQRAFRVTSHSSATTTVSYASNRVEGANIGIHWLGDTYAINPPAAVLPVLLTGNTLLGNGTAVWVHTDGTTELNSKATLAFNRIYGNGVGVQSDTALVSAENNWWGCNAGPGGAGCDTAVVSGGGVLDADPWLTLGIALGSSTLQLGDSTAATASLRMNSDGADTSVAGFLPDGIPVAFGATGGVVDPAAGLTLLSLAGSTYTAGALPGTFAVTAEVDGQLVSTPVTLFAPAADLYATLVPELQVVTDGGAVAWTATFGNSGPTDATGVGVSLAFAPELVGVAWTCSATGGAVCPAASGVGDVTATVDLPSGGSLQYAVTGAAPTPFAGVLAVTATVTAPVTISDPDPTNDVAVATVRSPGLFEDGFESGDLSAWSDSL